MPSRPGRERPWALTGVPSILAGALFGGFCAYHLLRGLGSQHLASGVVIGTFAGAWLGWRLCRRWQRHWWAREISHGLIDLLDLWIMCLDAGMSFQAALARAAQDSEFAQPVLRRELQLTQLHLRHLLLQGFRFQKRRQQQ